MTNKKIAKIAKEYDLVPDDLIKAVRDKEKKFKKSGGNSRKLVPEMKAHK